MPVVTRTETTQKSRLPTVLRLTHSGAAGLVSARPAFNMSCLILPTSSRQGVGVRECPTSYFGADRLEPIFQCRRFQRDQPLPDPRLNLNYLHSQKSDGTNAT
jgi:hypothetical protein